MSKITTDFVKSIRKLYEEVGTLLGSIKGIQRDVETIREHVVEDSYKSRAESQTQPAQKDRPPITTGDATQSKGRDSAA